MSKRIIARAGACADRRTPEYTVVNLRRTTTRRIYMASSLSTYKTPEYDRNLERISELFPHAEILAPRDLFTSNADWLNKWPGIVVQIDALVFFQDAQDFIGYGVWTEIHDAITHGVPVYLLADSSLHLWPDVEISERRPTNWRQFARLRAPQQEGSEHDG